MNRKVYTDTVTRILSTFQREVVLRNAVNLTEFNILAENFYRDLFNLVYEMGLGNLNLLNQNAGYIDLIDTENKIAIQVTSDNRPEKISRSIAGFFGEGDKADFRLKVLLIGRSAKEYRKDFTQNGRFTFDPEKDVIDIENLLAEILDKDIDKLKLIADYLSRSFDVSQYGSFYSNSLSGAERIDEAFIGRLERGEAFSRSLFYTGSQEEYCQWYGVLKNYDVSRNDYSAIEASIVDSYLTYSQYKVAAVIHGPGGCGKSTVLRRLALEIARKTQFKVYWILNTQIVDFCENALRLIQGDSSSSYLIFIEDWYRIDTNDKPLVEKFIREAQEVTNIRLVVGDRDPEGKVYWDNLPVKENAFELRSDENRRIVAEILERHPEWKVAASEALANANSYNSALFLILFVLAGISENRFEAGEVNFNDLKTTAQAIARYDIRTIAGVYPGLGKALFYWSCVYASHHIFITYESFLKIADHFEGNDAPSVYLTNWHADDSELKRLQLYINVGINDNLATRFQTLELVQFNHDKLAEDVISRLSFPGWLPYNGRTKKVLLNVLVETADDYSASVVASRFLLNETQLFRDGSEEKFYIDKLFFEKKNRNFHYLNRLIKFDLTASDLLKYIDILMEEGLYHPALWLGYFEKADEDEKKNAAKTILDREDLSNLQHEIVVAAFNQPGNKEEREKAAKTILDREDQTDLQHEIVVAAFNQPGNKEEREKAAKSILDREDLATLQHYIVVAAFNQPGNEEEKEKAAKSILDREDLATLKHEIAVAVFNQPGNEEEKEKAAKSILDREDLATLQHDIVVAAFNQPGNKEEKEKAAKSILDREDLVTLQHDIVVAVFNQSGNKEEKGKAAKRILENENIKSILPSVVVKAMKFVNIETLRIQTATNYLKDWRVRNSALVYSSLYAFSSVKNVPYFVSQIIEDIIKDYRDYLNHGPVKYFWFNSILKIPFHQVPAWKRASLSAIEAWKRLPRNLVVNLILSHRAYPDEIEIMCEDILYEWEFELKKPVWQLFGRQAHFGDHIRLAMGHPALRAHSTVAARQIVRKAEKDIESIPGYLLEVARNILEKNEYPTWDTGEIGQAI